MTIVFMFANGPQGWSAIIFSNAVVFHSFMHTCSVFIHLTPVLASYTFRWHKEIIYETFPGKIILYQYFDNCIIYYKSNEYFFKLGLFPEVSFYE